MPTGRNTIADGTEKERMLASSTAAVLTELARSNPLLITDPCRA